MLKIRSYLLIAFIVYSVTLLSALPASLVIDPLSKQLGGVLNVSQSSGTVWKGRVNGYLREHDFNLSWDFHLLDLFLLTLSADVHLKSTLLEFKSVLKVGFKRVELNELKGVIKAQPINALLFREGLNAEIDSDIYVKEINLKRSGTKFKVAQGQIDWDGGLVKVKELPGGKINLPPLQARLGLIEQGMSVMVVLKEQNSVSLLGVDLSHDGQAHLKLKERIAEYVEVPKQLLRGDPENVMFEIKRQIFETHGEF